jgi:MoaA/NifB/PqqE/SkfB family radical SAM enzyme
MTFKEIFSLLIQGGPGFCQVAVTNACNARCRFCNFPNVPPAERVMADLPGLLTGLESARRAGVRFLTVTGGEPLLYPELPAFLARARELGISVVLCTNGALLTPRRIQEMSRLGLDTVIISLDANSPARHDENRGLPGLTAHIQEMVPVLRRAGLDPVASVTLSRLVENLEGATAFLHRLGFKRMTFSYPITRLNSPYLGFAVDHSVDFTPEELNRWFGRIKELKAGAPPVTILNPWLGLDEMQRQLRGRPSRFPCLAGFKYFFVDWDLKVYRCHYLGETLGRWEEMEAVTPVRDGCTACTIECYREPSIFQYMAVSVFDALTAWSQGRWLRGLGALLHPHNFLSLAALLEGRHWVR